MHAVIAAIDWWAAALTTVLSVVAAAIGLISGYMLRRREWLLEKRLEMYDRYLTIVENQVNILSDLAPYIRTPDPTPSQDQVDLADARIENLSNEITAARRLQVVASARVMQIVGLLSGDLRLLGQITRDEEHTKDQFIKARGRVLETHTLLSLECAHDLGARRRLRNRERRKLMGFRSSFGKRGSSPEVAKGAI